jgi:hypothetical protein
MSHNPLSNENPFRTAFGMPNRNPLSNYNQNGFGFPRLTSNLPRTSITQQPAQSFTDPPSIPRYGDAPNFDKRLFADMGPPVDIPIPPEESYEEWQLKSRLEK